MKLEVKDNCPLNGFNGMPTVRLCVVHENQGNNPNTGEPTEEWGCSMAWLPILMIENAQQSRADWRGGREFQKRDGVGQSGEPAPTEQAKIEDHQHEYLTSS